MKNSEKRSNRFQKYRQAMGKKLPGEKLPAPGKDGKMSGKAAEAIAKVIKGLLKDKS